MTHLFLFTITPVQSFISQARKTQDLWAGSRMLSAFVGKVYTAISMEGGTIIFPSKIADSMPNRILASFDFKVEKTDQELKELGKKIAKAVANELEVLRQKAETKIGLVEYAKIKTTFKAQLEDYFSTFWVFVPCTKETYADAYDKADRLLGAVKNSRTFTQNPEQGRKCSLSGEQNALVVYKSKNLPAYTYDIVKDENDKNEIIPKVAVVSNPNINEGEGLSAISYIKRFYPFRKDKDKKEFDSTADIALLHTIFELKKIQAKGGNLFLNEFAFCASENQTENIDEIDGQLFFEENFTNKYFEKQNINIGFLELAKVKRDNIQRIAKENSLKFTKYYAILLFDADSMGKWLSGDFLTDKKQLQDFHKHISGLLSDFADYAKKYVDGELTEEDKKKNPELKNQDLKIKKGRTVYAGGDDYLGFVNLHYLFDVMKHLRWEFKEQVSDKISNNKEFQIIPNPKTNSDEMSFSAGISIAHYKTPLSEVLTWARKMEKEAKDKDTDKKDSFGIAVLKKSGEIHKAVLPFKETQTSYFSDKMQIIVSSLDGKFSNKFITSFEQETYLIADSGNGKKLNDDILDILEFEISRLTKRAKIEATDAELSNLQNSVNNILKSSNKDKKALSFDSPIQNFTASLNVCDFINRKLQGND